MSAELKEQAWGTIKRAVELYGEINTHWDGWPLVANGKNIKVNGLVMTKATDVPMEAMGKLLDLAEQLPQEKLNERLLEEMSRGMDGIGEGPRLEVVRKLLKEGAHANMRAESYGRLEGPSGLLLFTHTSKEVLELLLTGARPGDPHAANPDDELDLENGITTVGHGMLLEILEEGEPDRQKVRKIRSLPIAWEKYQNLAGTYLEGEDLARAQRILDAEARAAGHRKGVRKMRESGVELEP